MERVSLLEYIIHNGSRFNYVNLISRALSKQSSVFELVRGDVEVVPGIYLVQHRSRDDVWVHYRNPELR